MIKIGMQQKTTAKSGFISSYIFENESINLKTTLFYKIEIPLMPFDSGLEYVEQPEETSIIFDWYALDLVNDMDLIGHDLTSINYPDSEVTIYVGSAHNWCNVRKCKISKLDNNSFLIDCELFVEFENECVAKNESFCFKTDISYTK